MKRRVQVKVSLSPVMNWTHVQVVPQLEPGEAPVPPIEGKNSRCCLLILFPLQMIHKRRFLTHTHVRYFDYSFVVK